MFKFKRLPDVMFVWQSEWTPSGGDSELQRSIRKMDHIITLILHMNRDATKIIF